MLRLLRVRNLAVIEAVDVEFDAGLNALTGETGAGKSILIEAVGLLLGARASADLVRTGEAQASIEALFDTGDGEVVIRREITNQGRSRAFVNGALATNASLRELALQLVELHGQHEHQNLLDPLTHLPLLDSFLADPHLAAETGTAWERVRALRAQLERSRMDSHERTARLDLVTFQLSEIEKVAPRPFEDDELAATKQVLANAERLRRLCDEGYAALYDSEQAALASLSVVWKRVADLATLEPRFAPYIEARDGIKSQLEDLAFFLRQYADGIDASPGRLQEVEDRLVSLERLKRRHGPALQNVLDTLERLREEQAQLSDAGQSIESLQHALEAAESRYLAAARQLSHARRLTAVAIASDLEHLLAGLAMPSAKFDVRFEADLLPEEWGSQGIDRAEFYLSANIGEEPRPLARIVSGGELSRVMLALKTLASRARGADVSSTGVIRTLVFDEVDAGIGGRVADVVGARLQDLGAHFQVLCITHLPQIAARADVQFQIAKRAKAGRTVTSVHRLDETGRRDELMRMLGGNTNSGSLRDVARELLVAGQRQQRSGVEAKAKRKAKGESESRQKSETNG